MNAILLVAATQMGLAATVLAGSAGTFVGTGDLPGGLFQSGVYSVSADGEVVVGAGNMGLGPDASQPTAAKWTRTLGMRPIPGLLFSDRNSSANAVSADGSAICGAVWDEVEPRPFVWSQQLGVTIIPVPIPGFIWSASFSAISHDGSVAVGTVSGWNDGQHTARVFRWTASGGLQFVPGLDAPGSYNTATAVSDDGQVIMGTTSTGDGRYEPYRWTEASGIERLGVLPDFQSHWVADGTPDAQVMVGQGFLPHAKVSDLPFRWTDTNGLSLLPIPPDATVGWAYGVSSDGSVIVGAVDGEAAIWLGDNEFLPLSAYLTQLGIAGFKGWELHYAYDISADGHIIVGGGRNPQGNGEGFVVEIPPHCPGDADRDGAVSFADISAILTHWQSFGPQGDANDDFIVDFNDITETLTRWLTECP